MQIATEMTLEELLEQACEGHTSSGKIVVSALTAESLRTDIRPIVTAYLIQRLAGVVEQIRCGESMRAEAGGADIDVMIAPYQEEARTILRHLREECKVSMGKIIEGLALLLSTATEAKTQET